MGFLITKTWIQCTGNKAAKIKVRIKEVLCRQTQNNSFLFLIASQTFASCSSKQIQISTYSPTSEITADIGWKGFPHFPGSGSSSSGAFPSSFSLWHCCWVWVVSVVLVFGFGGDFWGQGKGKEGEWINNYEEAINLIENNVNPPHYTSERGINPTQSNMVRRFCVCRDMWQIRSKPIF